MSGSRTDIHFPLVDPVLRALHKVGFDYGLRPPLRMTRGEIKVRSKSEK